jgi:DNA-binding transcriptional regulator YiaG
MAYVYRHIRLDNNCPFYVGIGSDATYARANSVRNRNKFWKNIVGKTEYRVDIMMDDITYESAKAKEIEFISIYGKEVDGTGTLVNITNGGDGCKGLVHSSESREKMGMPNRGKKISEWHKSRISESHSGKVVSEVTRELISMAVSGENNPMYGKKRSEEAKMITSIASRGSKNKSSKLTESEVLKIRSVKDETGVSSSKIADMFNVSKSTVKGILARQTWKHI